MASLQASIEPFSGKAWTSWIQRLGFYFVVNSITADEKRRALLLTLCGPETFETVRALVAPKSPGEVPYEEIVQTLAAHYDPRPSELYCRCKFQRRDQQPGESIAVYVAALRKLAADCNFGVGALPAAEATATTAAATTALPLDIMLRDRFGCSIRNELVQQRLFAERDLTFQKAFDLAERAESAALQQKSIKLETEKLEVHKTSHKKGGAKGEQHTPRKAHCYRCDGSHDPGECKFRNSSCNYCKKIGHTERACIAKKKQRKTATHQMEPRPASREESGDSSAWGLNTVKSLQACPKFMVPLRVNGKLLEFEVDSGAAYSLISKETYDKSWSTKPPPLAQADLNLHTWSGEHLSLVGTAQVQVRHKTKDYVLPLHIMEGSGCNLLGRNWFSTLKIRLQGVNQTDDATHTEPAVLHRLLEKHARVFNEDVISYEGPPVHIELDPNVPPRFCKARPVPLALRPAVKEELDRLEKQGILQPVQHSDWATPLVLVRKKSGLLRLCGDYRSTVNAASLKAAYPLPTTEEVLSTLRGGRMFSTLDLFQAYQQLPVTENTAKVLTVNTMNGLYAVKRLPFGISAAPAIFQKIMETTLAGIPGTSVYLDDIIVCGETPEQHNERLDQVLSRLGNMGLRLQKDKCRFGDMNVEFLGHRIDEQGVHTTGAKVKAIIDAPAPKNRVQLQAFLGLLAFYDRFLKDRATVASRLYKLLHKETQWIWEKEHQKAFEELKKLIRDSTVLAHYDERKPLLLSCDASPYGVGAVLSQVDESGAEAPIAFASRTLGKAERNYAQLDREGLAVVFGVDHFQKYITGRHVTITTDHQPLLSILGPKKPLPQVLSPRMTRWCLKLSAYDYDLVYRKGSRNQNADALSRLPLQGDDDEPSPPGDVLMLECAIDPQLSPKRIAELSREDKTLSAVIQAAQQGKPRVMKGDDFRPYVKLASELSTLQGYGQADNQQEVPTAGAPECCATPAPLPSDDTLQGPPQRPPRRRRPPDRYQDQW
ncbi:uncharacterized protein LOC119405417 [Rhipicephalus sanguineus]|uniref:uncharacterized protein LOC119405417 n=1 Tax=Rhipicephalus sanguineus TaxID=34632 RepID=UPI001895A8B3|nr:uncharacterized protein LOC119405417 [Rhipicephalus sanguineus]